MSLILLQEVKDILHSVVLRNMLRESLHIKKESFEAWRRVVEVTLASCPTDILPKDTRQTVIADILQDLLSKVHEWPSQLINFNSPIGSFYFSFSFSFSCSPFFHLLPVTKRCLLIFTYFRESIRSSPPYHHSSMMYLDRYWSVERDAADSEPDGTNTVFKLLNRKRCFGDDILERLKLSSLFG